MVSYVEVKKYTTLQAVAEWLGLRCRANDRYDCPHASNGQRAITFSPEWKNKDGSLGRFTCWACDVSGDLIALAAHINKTDDMKAAKEIQSHFHGYEPVKRGLTSEAAKKVDSELEFEHPLVQGAGLSVEHATRLNIGFRKAGTKPNSVLIPIRDDKGERALRLINDGALDDSGVEVLANRLGIGSRHLSKLFRKHLGASPLQVAKTVRVQRAKRLLDQAESIDGGDCNARQLWQSSAVQCRLRGGLQAHADRDPQRELPLVAGVPITAESGTRQKTSAGQQVRQLSGGTSDVVSASTQSCPALSRSHYRSWAAGYSLTLEDRHV